MSFLMSCLKGKEEGCTRQHAHIRAASSEKLRGMTAIEERWGFSPQTTGSTGLAAHPLPSAHFLACYL